MRSEIKRGPMPEGERLLIDAVERLMRSPQGWRAVFLRLSGLRAENRREHYIRVAASSFDPILARRDGQCFIMSSKDLVFLARQVEDDELDEALRRIDVMFAEDPLIGGDGDRSDYWRTFDLGEDFDSFSDFVAEIEVAWRVKKRRSQAADEVAASRGSRQPSTQLDPMRLMSLQNAIEAFDLSALLRRQTVCALLPDSPPRAVFCEAYLSIEELGRKLMPDVQITSSRWLFQHLTEVLDRRMMKMLPELEANIELSTSININVQTLLTEEFLEFDRNLRRLTRKSIILELQSLDVYGNIDAYMFARDFVRERGYKVCLDGLSPLSFPMIRREELGSDLQKVYWTRDMADRMETNRRQAFAEAVRSAGPARVVLARCDDQRALDFGADVGISMFQGFAVDRLLREQRTAAA